MNADLPIGALLGMLVAAGALLLWLGATQRVRTPRLGGTNSLTRARTALTDQGFGARDVIVLTLSLIAGAAYAAATGFWAVVVLLPAAAWGMPRVLAAPSTAQVERLDALSQWVRRLAGLITTGHQLRQTLTTSVRSTPPAIRPQVQTLVNRLRAGRPTDVALYQFGDDLADPTADKVVAALIKASQARGPAVAEILNDLARMVSEEVNARRQVATAQTSPRTTARVVTAITTLILVFFIFFSSQGAVYRTTTTGQLVLIGLSAIFGLLLWWIRAMSMPPPVTRFIQTPEKITRELQGARP